MIDLILAFVTGVPPEITSMQALINEWTAAITAYVLKFVHLIMPIFIYIMVFQIVIKKS